jgi:hypothetical protein
MDAAVGHPDGRSARSAQSAITGLVFRTVRIPFRWLANEGKTFEFRDRVMALFAPIGLVTLPGVWLALITVGYMGMFWSLDTRSLGDAFHLSGSSLTTLGFASADQFWERLLAFTEAGLGLFTLTLVITYLPSMYGAFSRRETQVGLLEVRAGSPPSAVEFILRHHRIAWLDDSTAIGWSGRDGSRISRKRTPHTRLSTSSVPRGRHRSRLRVVDGVDRRPGGTRASGRLHPLGIHSAETHRRLLRHRIRPGSQSHRSHLDRAP